MKTIISMAALVLFINKPVLAQEQKRNAIQFKFNHLTSFPVNPFDTTTTYHRGGMGVDFNYDRLLLTKFGFGISIKAGLQQSPLTHSEDHGNYVDGDKYLVRSRYNLNAYRLGIGPYFYERIDQDFYLLSKFYFGYNFMDIIGNGFLFTNDLELVDASLNTAPFWEYSVELVFEINETISILMGGQLSFCSFEIKDLLNPDQIERVNYHNMGFNTGFRIKL